MPIWVSLGWNFKKTIVIHEISTLEFESYILIQQILT